MAVLSLIVKYQANVGNLIITFNITLAKEAY